MKVMKHLLASLFVLGTVFTGTAMATEKAAEPAAQTEQPAATAAVSQKVNINTASAAEIQKALVGIGAKKRKPSCNTVKNTARLALSSNY